MSDVISPARAQSLIREGAVLIDIREADERAREYIPGSKHLPLSRIEEHGIPHESAKIAIFHCRSGVRTRAQAQMLKEGIESETVYIVEGGIGGWKLAGLDTIVDRSQPIDIFRQVMITAGTLVLTGVMLGTLVHPAFYGVSAFVGAGLAFSGISGTCMMANLLSLMPWNRQVA